MGRDPAVRPLTFLEAGGLAQPLAAAARGSSAASAAQTGPVRGFTPWSHGAPRSSFLDQQPLGKLVVNDLTSCVVADENWNSSASSDGFGLCCLKTLKTAVKPLAHPRCKK
ncbi:hypothetical protein NDU88_003768 [Pleurodeles waltl]|uniref:Uncharacterized protein n=1 Tax=Pleurodeles waltl TaxID=8319 RepID=A0AAV7RDV2_PLEWA|nr:hypothetical protein NDU88_003768 [Pleurodeles waltl]